MSQHQNQQPSENQLPQLNPLNSPSSPSQNNSSSSSSPLPSFSFVASDNDDSGIFSIDDYDAFDASDVQAQQQLISTLLSSPDNTTATATATTTTVATSYHRHHKHQHQHQVRFVSYPYYLPLSPSYDSSSYVTINGNEETCGSSFSDTCSLMASFDTCGVRFPDAFSGFHNHLDTFNSRDSVVDAEADVWDWSDFLKEESCF